VEGVVQDILAKVAGDAITLKAFPHITNNGKWRTTSDGYWTGGFWVGLLWLCYKFSHEEKYLRAYDWLRLIERRRKEKTFDLGFLFCPSFVLGYQIAGDKSLKEIVLEAAVPLSGLFHEKTGLIYNEVEVNGQKIGRTAIDVMMNLPLLWWAYEETGDKK